MKLKNKNIGGKVIVKEVLLSITKEHGWKYHKKITGVLVEKNDVKPYYYSCNGNQEHIRQHIIKYAYGYKYYVKLDNDVVDIAGNNILPMTEEDLIFIDHLENVKIISKSEYNKAMKIIKEYDSQQLLK
jgi:hypothetical protein